MMGRKVWRDLKTSSSAYLACISVIAIGILIFVSFNLLYESVARARDDFYRDYGFADGFLRLQRAPAQVAERVEKLPGIAAAVGRWVEEVRMYRQESRVSTRVRLLAYQDVDQSVNRWQLLAGQLPVPGQRQLVVSETFLKGNDLRIGAELALVIRGSRINFTITGICLSPEYVYEVPEGRAITPDPQAFGVAYLPWQTLAGLTGEKDQINEVVFRMTPGTEFEQLKKMLEEEVGTYSIIALYPRSQQLSHSVLDQKLQGLQKMAKSAPVIFLLVAAAILYLMLRRMAEQQRRQIGTMKAFGYTQMEILAHYLSYPALTGFAGGLIGGLAGIALAYPLVALYRQYFNIPGLVGRFSWSYLLGGIVLSLLFSIVAGYQGCRRILILPPAMAMRKAPPQRVRRTPLELWPGLWQQLSVLTKMAWRNLFRAPQQSLLTLLGIAIAFALMVMGRSMFDATAFMLDYQFNQVEQYDLKISLRQLVSHEGAVRDAAGLPGVVQAEAILEVPATLINKGKEKDVSLLGLARGQRLYWLQDVEGRSIAVPASGIVLSEQLAQVLAVKTGDEIWLRPLSDQQKERRVKVMAVVPQFIGLGAYLDLDYLSEILHSPPVASDLLLKVDASQQARLQEKLQAGANVLTVFDKEGMRQQFSTLLQSNQASQVILLIFAFVTGFAVVYNTSQISLAERQHELATLRVLGMTRSEIARILATEQLIKGLLGVALGIPLAYGLVLALARAVASDLYTLPVVIRPGSYLLALAGTAAFLLVAHWSVKDKIGKLPLLEVLKEQE